MIPCVDIKIRSYTGGMAQTNAYLLGENDNCILIDAPLGVGDWLKSEGAKPSDVLLTHQHYDHIEGVAALKAEGVSVYAHSPYSENLTLEKLLQQSGIALTIQPYCVDTLLENENLIEIGDWEFTISYVPGHAPDSLAFRIGDRVFVGDTLFASGVGRPDLPGGDMELLLNSIRQELLTLDDATRIFPGHGPATTIGTERSSNPYL